MWTENLGFQIQVIARIDVIKSQGPIMFCALPFGIGLGSGVCFPTGEMVNGRLQVGEVTGKLWGWR